MYNYTMSDILKRLVSAIFMCAALMAFIICDNSYLPYCISVIAVVCLVELNVHYTQERILILCAYNAYIVISMLAVYYVRASSPKLMLLLFLITISADSFAYIFGRMIGGPKLCPTISPSKTISGAICGLIGATIVGYCYTQDANISVFDGFKDVTALLGYGQSEEIKKTIGLLLMLISLTLSSIVGDLLASKIKRIIGIKDFSNIIPGHGGFLDRLDSIMLVSVMYCVIKIFYTEIAPWLVFATCYAVMKIVKKIREGRN